MTHEEILYQYYLKSTIKSRNNAIELLEKRDFTSLNRDYIHWFNTKLKNVKLKANKISDVIKELSNIKFEDNESEPFLSCLFENTESISDGNIEITSFIYTIVTFEKCESLAKIYTNDSLWKLKHQPNGKDAEKCRKILNINI